MIPTSYYLDTWKIMPTTILDDSLNIFAHNMRVRKSTERATTNTTDNKRRLLLTKKNDKAKSPNTVKLKCGCEYEDYGWMLIRLSECPKHKKQRTTPKPKRPKAECVRAGGRYD